MDDGTVVDKLADMEHMTTAFFQELYTADQSVIPQIVLDHVEPQVNQMMSENLCKVFWDEQISNARIFHMTDQGFGLSTRKTNWR
jgi:hypothetical protein